MTLLAVKQNRKQVDTKSKAFKVFYNLEYSVNCIYEDQNAFAKAFTTQPQKKNSGGEILNPKEAENDRCLQFFISFL